MDVTMIDCPATPWPEWLNNMADRYFQAQDYAQAEMLYSKAYVSPSLRLCPASSCPATSLRIPADCYGV
jgi:hypothetical protein